MMDPIFNPATVETPNWLIAAMLLVTGVAWAVSKQPGARKLAAIAFGGALALGLMNLLNAIFAGTWPVIR
jgi:hypothetical protein